MIKYIDKKNTYIDETVKIGDGTTIYPNVCIEGKTVIGKNCIIGMGSYIKDSAIGDNTTIYNSQILDSQIGNDNRVGPYSNIRPGNVTKDSVKVGSFVELKNTKIEANSKVPHLSYIGDAEIGNSVNIGCGTVTANYDGINKNKTIIKDNSFIGCNAILIAPLTINENTTIGAGSTITDDVPANALGIARERQINIEDYNKKGFTLTELLAIITILGLISVIVVSSVVSMIKKSNKQLCQTQIESIIISAKEWGSEHLNLLPDEGDEPVEISIGTLKSSGKIGSDLKNPMNNETISDDLNVTITNQNGSLVYTFGDICN